MLGIFWAKGLQPSAASGIQALPGAFPSSPPPNRPPPGVETCLAQLLLQGPPGARGRCSTDQPDQEQAGPGVHFPLVWPLDWMGSEIGWRGQSLPLVLGPLGLSEGPESSIWPPYPSPLYPCPPPRTPRAPGQTTHSLQPQLPSGPPRLCSPRQSYVYPPFLSPTSPSACT